MVNAMRGSRFDAGRSFRVYTALKRIPFEVQVKKGKASQEAIAEAGGVHPFNNAPLTLYLVDNEGRFLRAADLLVDGRFSSQAPAAAANVKAFEVVTPNGSILADPSFLNGKTPAEVDEYLIQVDILHAAVASRRPVFPQTLDVKGQTYKRIMLEELTGIEAAQFLKPEEVSGHNADELQLRLRNPSGKALVYTNVDDAVAYIKAANEQGRKFRFMTDAEFEALPAEVKSQLKGDNWFLVETSRGSGQYCWRSLHSASRYDRGPGDRCGSSGAVRLVED